MRVVSVYISTVALYNIFIIINIFFPQAKILATFFSLANVSKHKIAS